MFCIYYIYIIIRSPKLSYDLSHVCIDMGIPGLCKHVKDPGGLVPKARAIKSGETPQKSLILPPVHTFTKVLVAPANLMFS